MGKSARVGAWAVLACILGAASAPQPDLGIPVFPSDNPWNWDITGLAVHPNSANYINQIGALAPIREDYSFYYSVVTNAQANVDVPFSKYPDESDPGPAFGSPINGTASFMNKGSYPIPPGAPIEVGSDAHLLVINTQAGLLYETYQTSGGPGWSASCGAIFDLNSNLVRPEGWTSADAAGLPIFPGLIRYDEVTAGAITHALRFTCGHTQSAHIYPARHDAGTANLNYPPMGLRVRLKASKDLSVYSGAALVILQALKKHGLILADNGRDWFISTTDDSRWVSTNITQIRTMVGSDFEVVTSVDASGNPILPVSSGGTGPPPPPPPPPGGGGCGATGMESVLFLALLRFRRSRRSESSVSQRRAALRRDPRELEPRNGRGVSGL